MPYKIKVHVYKFAVVEQATKHSVLHLQLANIIQLYIALYLTYNYATQQHFITHCQHTVNVATIDTTVFHIVLQTSFLY